MTATTAASTHPAPLDEGTEAPQASLDSYWQASFEDSRRIAWLSGQVDSLRVENARVHRELDSSRLAFAQAQQHLAQVELHLADIGRSRADALAQLDAVRTSRSWRAAAPLRWFGTVLRRLLGR